MTAPRAAPAPRKAGGAGALHPRAAGAWGARGGGEGPGRRGRPALPLPSQQPPHPAVPHKGPCRAAAGRPRRGRAPEPEAAARPPQTPTSPGGVRPRAVASGLLSTAPARPLPRSGAALSLRGGRRLLLLLGGGRREAGTRGQEPPPGQKRSPRRAAPASQAAAAPPSSPSGNAFLPGRVSRAPGGRRRGRRKPEAGTKELPGSGAARGGGGAGTRPRPAGCLSFLYW